MALITLIGDCTTTTAVALASRWVGASPVVVVEADRTGGSLAGWLDTPAAPSLSTIVAAGRAITGDQAWSTVTDMVQVSPAGVSFIAAPVRSREANRAIEEAERGFLRSLPELSDITAIADVGRPRPGEPLPVLAQLADVVLICHRQRISSAAAASVRLERLAELVELVADADRTTVVAIVGDEPFDRHEIERFLSDETHASFELTVLPLDELSAAVYAGRTGVSQRRLHRLPLSRAAHDLARGLADATGDAGTAATPATGRRR